MKKTIIKICKICGKKFKIKRSVYSLDFKNEISSKKGCDDNDEGIFYLVWFCNDCWNKIIKKIQEK